MDWPELKTRILEALSKQTDPQARIIEQAIHDLERAEPVYPIGFPREAWLDWRAFRRREKKGWYKTLKSEQEAIETLWQDAEGDVDCLLEAIRKARQSRHTGIYPKPKRSNGQPDSKEKLRSLVIEAQRQGRGRPGGGGTLF
jgi:hypothetical protein